jgi:DNA-binding transcriptional MerR regulator
MGTFHAGEALRICGLSYKQLDHTLRTGAMRDSAVSPKGAPRRFTERDLLALTLLADVLGAGVRASAVAPALRLVQDGHGIPRIERLTTAHVWTDGHHARLILRKQQQPLAARGLAYLLDLGAAAKRLRTSLRGLNEAAA